MTVDEVIAGIQSHIPGCDARRIANGSPAGQESILIDRAHLRQAAAWLRDAPEFRLDYCSNLTGVDWPDHEVAEKVRVTKVENGEEKEVEETRKAMVPGYLETVYHLYSIEKRHGPVILRARTGNRTDDVTLPSLTPVWRSAEFQEREVFDLYGIVFEGHPDLRRLLMWEGFRDHPMRKDYVPPADDDDLDLAADTVGSGEARRARLQRD